MIIQIPLSASGPADAFAAAVEAHRADLAAHRSGLAGIPAPIVAPLIDSLIARVPRGDPLPDDFVVLPYEIVDDSPTLADHKASLQAVLHQAQIDAVAAVLSPARARLLDLDVTEAFGVPEETRSPAQAACIEVYVAFQARCGEITRNAALAALEIEELDAVEAAKAWKVPAL